MNNNTRLSVMLTGLALACLIALLVNISQSFQISDLRERIEILESK